MLASNHVERTRTGSTIANATQENRGSTIATRREIHFPQSRLNRRTAFSKRVEIVIADLSKRAQTSFCFVREANDTEERMRVWFVGAAAAAGLVAFGLAGCSESGAKTKVAQAQQVVLEGKSVTASGCVRPVETTSCLVVRGPGGGYYDISTASPAPDPAKGVAVSLQGKDQGKNTQCGRQLTDVRWSYLGIQCAPPATSASAADAKADKKAG